MLPSIYLSLYLHLSPICDFVFFFCLPSSSSISFLIHSYWCPVYLSTYLLCTLTLFKYMTHPHMHTHTHEHTYFDSFSNVNTISFVLSGECLYHRHPNTHIDTRTKVIGFLVYWPHHNIVCPNEWSLFRLLLIIIYDTVFTDDDHCCVKLCIQSTRTNESKSSHQIHCFIPKCRKEWDVCVCVCVCTMYNSFMLYIRFSDDSNAIKLLACMWSNGYRISIFVLCSSVFMCVHTRLPQTAMYWNNIIDQPLI